MATNKSLDTVVVVVDAGSAVTVVDDVEVTGVEDADEGKEEDSELEHSSR